MYSPTLGSICIPLELPSPCKLHMYSHHVLSACVISHPLLKDGAFREVGGGSLTVDEWLLGVRGDVEKED